MMVSGEGAHPTRAHLEQLARDADLKKPGPNIDAVRAAVNRFAKFADEASLRAKTRDRVAKALGVPARVPPRKARRSP